MNPINAILATLVVASFSGCFWNAKCGDYVAEDYSWSRDPVYDRFPAPGRVGSYEIEHHWNAKTGQLTSKTAFRFEDPWAILLRAFANETNTLSFSADEPLSDAVAASHAAALFDELNLGESPLRATTDLDWQRPCG